MTVDHFSLAKHNGYGRINLNWTLVKNGIVTTMSVNGDVRSIQFLWNNLRRKRELTYLETFDHNTRIIQKWSAY